VTVPLYGLQVPLAEKYRVVDDTLSSSVFTAVQRGVTAPDEAGGPVPPLLTAVTLNV